MTKAAFLFPGQGAQTVGMGRAAYDAVPAAKTLFDRAGGVLGYDLADLCFNGPQDRLNTTDHSQPAIFVASLAALEKLRAEQPELEATCIAAAGLSLGEYTALVFAGVFEFEDALRVVRERGRAMQAAAEAAPSGMVAVLGLELLAVEALCQQYAEGDILRVANLLCPGNIVISGSQAACQRVIAGAATQARLTPLAVAGAFHTPLMQAAVERLRAALAGVKMQKPRLPVILNVDAQPHDDPEEIRQLLTRQVVEPVRWEDSVRGLLALGCDAFYEVGPGRVLRGLLKRIERKAAAFGVFD